MKNVNNTLRAVAFAIMAGTVVIGTTACAVARDQQTVGAYVDDATITTQVKAKLVEDKTTSAASINVETLNGTVQLSGFAKSSAERSQAAALAQSVKGVKSVRNDVIVRP
ncbi:MAG: Osmotically-inducible protein Y [Paracidovorax wautersii]|uniref:Osmotically-inducible protein Y n=1 Tax=Paracidovorax wautersii TaxID=1177982 RepID=A0A7V8FQM0_9BURK|nr:MAG: Osmotically-inducible protein Y [Paracidovorax wautersii]